LVSIYVILKALTAKSGGTLHPVENIYSGENKASIVLELFPDIIPKDVK